MQYETEEKLSEVNTLRDIIRSLASYIERTQGDEEATQEKRSMEITETRLVIKALAYYITQMEKELSASRGSGKVVIVNM